MNTRMIFAAVTVLLLAAVAGLGAWYVLYLKPPKHCDLSGRPIHPHMLTIARVDGERVYTCCPRCPLTLALQEHKEVEFLDVTDHVTGKRLRASAAYFVEGSRVEVCSVPRLERDETRTPYFRLFDRCGPSVLAFAKEDQAREFLRREGGQLKRLDELMDEITATAPLEEDK